MLLGLLGWGCWGGEGRVSVLGLFLLLVVGWGFFLWVFCYCWLVWVFFGGGVGFLFGFVWLVFTSSSLFLGRINKKTFLMEVN